MWACGPQTQWTSTGEGPRPEWMQGGAEEAAWGPAEPQLLQETQPALWQDFLLIQSRLLVFPLKNNIGKECQGKSLCSKHTCKQLLPTTQVRAGLSWE